MLTVGTLAEHTYDDTRALEMFLAQITSFLLSLAPEKSKPVVTVTVEHEEDLTTVVDQISARVPRGWTVTTRLAVVPDARGSLLQGRTQVVARYKRRPERRPTQLKTLDDLAKLLAEPAEVRATR